MSLHPAAQGGPAVPAPAPGGIWGGEELERRGKPSPYSEKGGVGRGVNQLWRQAGTGRGAKKWAGLGAPKDLSLEKFVSPPLTLTLFLGSSFLRFAFREGRN